MTAIQGDGWAPLPVAPVHEPAMARLPTGRHAVKKLAKQVGLDRRGASRNRAGGFDAAHHRQGMFKAGLIPTIHEKPRHRKTTTRARQRFVNAAIQALRRRGERTIAGEDPCKRWLRRVDHSQPRHDGMQLLAYPLMNLREFCGT